jgi:tungstate transport system substrate-binding protein
MGRHLWLLGGLLWSATVWAGERHILLASTTSTENSGLFAWLLPAFEAQSGIAVRVVAVGTGAALEMGRRCDADVLLVHAPEAERAFVDAGFGLQRHEVMYNDYLLLGPPADPAGVAGLGDVAQALRQIAARQTVFISRGDDSGTHRTERALWRAAGLDPSAASGSWYRESGAGMGATLNTARAMGAYTLSDRGTWLGFGTRDGLREVLAGDPRLFNPYGVIAVHPQRCPRVRAAEAARVVDWLRGPAGQARIASFRIGGEPLFIPSAGAAP